MTEIIYTRSSNPTVFVEELEVGDWFIYEGDIHGPYILTKKDKQEDYAEAFCQTRNYPVHKKAKVYKINLHKKTKVYKINHVEIKMSY